MMLTGDHTSSAWRVANAVGINEVYSSLKPEDKLKHVKKIYGDMSEGINDAPALVVATVGIVLAHCASATYCCRDNISSVPFSIAKARQTTSLVLR
ncbi:hypothetical protein V6N13_113653 [Hibiscus sabdariffa]|uniref:H(+)-exporting diphosphatase n=1 Tax=Hibiscus sabdariffa TaxID=183260 RepID=A0ABR2TZN0_9ROSI